MPRRSSASSSTASATPCSRATSRSERPEAAASLTIAAARVVADVRVERGRDGERHLGVVLVLLPVGLDPLDAALGEEPARGREELDRLEQVPGHERDLDVQLEVALHPADRDRRVVSDHLGRDLADDLGDDRVHLAGHDRRALLELGDEDLGQAGARARSHPADVVGDLGQRDGDGLQRARRLDEAVAGSLRLERVGGRRDREARWRRRAGRGRARRTPGGCSGPCPWRCRRAGSGRGAEARTRRGPVPSRTCAA